MNARLRKSVNLFFFVLILLPVLCISLGSVRYYLPFQIVNVVIAVFVGIHIFPFVTKTNSRLDSNTMVYLFTYFFLVIAPLYQFSKGITIWGGIELSDFDYFLSSVIVLFALCVYDFFYRYFVCREFFSVSHCLKKARQLSKRSKMVPICLSLLASLFTLYAFRNYPYLLFFREFNDGDKIVFDAFSNTSLNLIYIIVIRPIPVLVLVFYNFIFKKIDWWNIILLLLVLMTNFPLSLPRFFVAGVYLPLLFSYFQSFIYKDLVLKMLVFLGVLYVFPFLNQGRTVTNVSDIDFGLRLNYEMFLQGHFDSFQNMARVISHNTITYGQQLMGVFLFWFPRSLFPDKPIGSGGYIAHLYNLDFDHISLNYWGEGWINFGILGVILFSVILAFINAKADFKFWNVTTSTLYKVQYYIYMGLMFFILRGDLISCFAYTIGLLISTYICYKSFVCYANSTR